MNDQCESPTAGARVRLRKLQQVQAAALEAYVVSAARTAKARAALAHCEGALRSALGVLASTTAPEVAAQLTGVTLAAAREALAVHRRDAAAAEQWTGGSAVRSGR